MKNILLTGASGFIGSCILKKILKLNYTVYAIGNTKVKFRHKNFKFIKQNLKKKIVLNKKVNFDYIIHTAAISPAKNISDEAIMSYNLKSTENIINFAKDKKIQNLIFLSSISIYGKITEKSLKVSTKIRSPDMYGKSKLFNEKLIHTSGMKAVSIRLPGVVGKSSKRNLLTRIVSSKKKTIYAYNKFSKFNNTINVENLSDFIISLCKKKFKKGHYPILVSSKEPIKIHKVLNIIAPDKKIVYRPSNINSFIIDNSVAIKKYNFNPWTVTYTLQKFKKEYC